MNLIRIKNIVILYGPQNSCKTSILVGLQKELSLGLSSCDIKKIEFGRKKSKCSGTSNDKCVLLRRNGCVIAICSGGDSADVVLRNFIWMEQNAFPEYNIDIAIMAIRKQKRRDGVGDSNKSFPLLALEELEDRHYLNVIRPYVDSGLPVGGLTNRQIVVQKRVVLAKLRRILKRHGVKLS